MITITNHWTAGWNLVGKLTKRLEKAGIFASRYHGKATYMFAVCWDAAWVTRSSRVTQYPQTSLEEDWAQGSAWFAALDHRKAEKFRDRKTQHQFHMAEVPHVFGTLGPNTELYHTHDWPKANRKRCARHISQKVSALLQAPINLILLLTPSYHRVLAPSSFHGTGAVLLE